MNKAAHLTLFFILTTISCPAGTQACTLAIPNRKTLISNTCHIQKYHHIWANFKIVEFWGPPGKVTRDIQKKKKEFWNEIKISHICGYNKNWPAAGSGWLRYDVLLVAGLSKSGAKGRIRRHAEYTNHSHTRMNLGHRDDVFLVLFRKHYIFFIANW